MDLSRLKETDIFGRFYLKLPGDRQFENYFRTIDALRPLLASKEWAHMMVNMILPGDFKNNWNYFLSKKLALRLDEINIKMQGLDFQISLE